MSDSENEKVLFIEPLPVIHAAVKKLHARGAALLIRINEDIQQLNDLITEYNRANNHTDRIAKLKQLEATRQRLDDAYSDDQISFFSFFFHRIIKLLSIQLCTNHYTSNVHVYA